MRTSEVLASLTRRCGLALMLGCLHGCSSLPGLPAFLGGEPDDGIGTTPRDAWQVAPSSPLAGVELAPELYHSLLDAPRAPDGAFLLRPGLYAATVRSYCVRIGTHAPAPGEGYRPAPLLGRNAELIGIVVRGTERHPEIPQTVVQQLIWAILSDTRLQHYPPEVLAAARTLLPPEELAALAVDTKQLLDQALGYLPSEATRVMDAMRQVRNLFEQGSATYEQLERIAVLPPRVSGPVGEKLSWSLHPDGYYIRTLPDSYQRTRVEVLVPPLGADQEEPPSAQAKPRPQAISRAPFQNVFYMRTLRGYQPFLLTLPSAYDVQRLVLSGVASVFGPDLAWRHVSDEDDTGGLRCTSTWVVFTRGRGIPRIKCDIEICTPYSNWRGPVPQQYANYATQAATTEAAALVIGGLNTGMMTSEICNTWKLGIRALLAKTVPGATVSSPGTTR